MSELYVNLYSKPDPENPRSRSCAVCGAPLNTRGGVYMAPMETSLCRKCSHDLLEATTPGATTIPAHSTPQAGRRGTVRKADDSLMHKGGSVSDVLVEFTRLLIEYAKEHPNSQR